MPELPEVQTIVNELQKTITGKKISQIDELRKGTVINRLDESVLNNTGRIIQIKRNGKYISIDTDRGITLVVHLRMTGKLIYSKQAELCRHTRAIVSFSDSSGLLFDDVRTFGKIEIISSDTNLISLKKIGEEPLSKNFDTEKVISKLTNSSSLIKTLLLRQDIIAGLGNIYVNEALFRSKISPLRTGSSLTECETILLLKNIKKVLGEAIRHNGTTISDYRRIDDKAGEFQNFLQVYQKKKCICGAEIIRVKQGGRSSFYCPNCQK